MRVRASIVVLVALLAFVPSAFADVPPVRADPIYIDVHPTRVPPVSVYHCDVTDPDPAP